MNDNEDSGIISEPIEEKKISRKEAISVLWRKGLLWYKLNDSQKQLYDLVANAEKRHIVFLCSRRFGKSFVLCLMAIEKCIKEKNAIVKYLCPDAKQARTIIVPIIREILEDCPKSLRPEFLKNDGKYVFPNGSEIQIAGNDGGRAESLRGGKAHLCIIDEAGFCDNLTYNVNSILFPTVSTTGGKIVLSSTPPKTAGHEFVEEYIDKAKHDGTFIKKTIFENPRFTPAQVREIIENYKGGIENPEFRREYMCDLSINTDDMIIPEFTEALKLDIVKEWKRPVHFDYYESMDIGGEDFSAVLFAYYDFRADKIIIEDEYVINRMTTQTLANGIKAKEEKLLYDPITNDYRKPYLRISDTNLIVLADMHRLHGLTFLPTAKDNKEAAINNVRIMMNAQKIIIHPRCTTLVRHLQQGKWKKSSSGQTRTYARSSDNGHFDCIDALVYLVRNIQFSRNPYPSNYGLSSSDTRFDYNKKSNANPEYEKFATQFRPKKSIRYK